jgi:hypothetical protein
MRQCWNCKYFVADNPATLLSGRCHRHAPSGLDYLTYRFINRSMCHLEFGNMDPSGDVFGNGDLVPLYQNADNWGTTLCWDADDSGWNDSVINPFMIPFAGKIVRCQLAAARLNTGAATVGTNPILKIQQVQVRGTNQLVNPDVIKIPINPLYCQARDTAADNFHDIAIGTDVMHTLTMNPLSQGAVGYRVDCTAEDENQIYQFRLLKISFLICDWNGVDIGPEASLEKWAFISDGTQNKCGEYARSIVTVPPIPVP